MTSRLKHDDILLLEQPLLKVPTDALRSSLRSTQRVLERDFDKLNTSLKEVAADGASPPQSTILTDLDQSFVIDIEKSNQTVKVIDNLLSKARGLKRKLDDTYHNPRTGMDPSLNRIKARIDNLQNLYSSEYSTDLTYKKFSQTRLDRHLVDFMLRSGHTKSAQSLSQVANIEMLTDAPLFSELDRIEKALNDHSCSEALAWCKENSAALKKSQSTLEFELRYQEFIELVKAKKFKEAISYSQKQLVPWQSTRLTEISQVMTLLAFDQRTRCPPYARLYDESRWKDLLASFRSTLFTLLSIPEQPFLHLSLSVGLASLKLPACYDNLNKSTPIGITDQDQEIHPPSFQTRLPNASDLDGSTTSGPGDSNHTTTSNLGGPPPPSSSSNYDPSLIHRTDNVNRDYSQRRNPDCPTCDPVGLGELAKECPWSHHVNSIIVCGLTGKVVNDGDGLAVLPNGRVYSKDGLESRACKDGGKIVCPRTGQVFDINEIRRVFIS
ncbi:hypothetical protein MJO28_008383 [Puccinia striiformis f. sp. tritici]|uniref:Uncharacterized protein n=1 Tax=Puccinia striiformis f. sp. tritici TaxID=168172 RepID=A0ACC0EAC5_9BASI|nr:hypothetical protein MJO28_008383 [Puccinia striiformis f. sp. tritici]